ncbi:MULTISPECIES: hypothetical protein [Bradyrhizobium]|uniref:hypothetical protein n=1 Tax=Bradyrhizobium elkanii TaxID=29448 RepID=UPI000489E4E3|nr:hypothetical protein [Bradyrhizobium elkanii]
MHKLETAIVSLTKRGEQLAAKRVVAQDALDKASKARLEAHLSGDLDDQRALDNLQAAVDMAASTLAGLDEALGVLAQQKAEAEAQLAAERERAERAAAADKLEKQVAAIGAALPKYLEQSRVLADALSEIGHWHFESAQMASFIINGMGQVEIAANFALAELRMMPERIKTGGATIPRDQREPAAVAVVEPRPATQEVFMMRSAKFRDHEGAVRIARQYDDAEMPVQTAQRALRRNVAVPVSDPRRAKLRGARGGFAVDPRSPDVVDLDDETSPSRNEELASEPVGNFTVIDRSSESRTIKVAGPDF